MITTKQANSIIRKQNAGAFLTPGEESYLEEFMFNTKPSKQCMALVDKLNGVVYTDTQVLLEIGTLDTFNGACMFYTHRNNLMYHGVYEGSVEVVEGCEKGCGWVTLERVLFTVDKACEGRV